MASLLFQVVVGLKAANSGYPKRHPRLLIHLETT